MATLLVPVQVADLVTQAALRHGIDPALARAVQLAENAAGDPRAVSSAGALGLMQILPGPYGPAPDRSREELLDPETNVEVGVGFLAALLRHFGDVTRAIAGYNAGPRAVEEWDGVPPFAETQAYVPRVLAYYAELRTAPLPAAPTWPVEPVAPLSPTTADPGISGVADAWPGGALGPSQSEPPPWKVLGLLALGLFVLTEVV